MKVQEILATKSPTVITAKPDQSIHEASQLLAKHNIGALVVVDNANVPVGIISERDIVRAFAADADSMSSKTVGEIMTKDVVTARPDSELDQLGNVMTQKRFRHLPIVQDKELLGMISIGDVLKARLDHAEGEALNLRQYVTGGYG